MAGQQVFFTAEEVAHLLRIHLVTVRAWLRAGELKGIAFGAFGGRKGGRIRAEDLAAFIERKAGVTTTQEEVAAKASMSKSTVNRLELGVKEARISIVRRWWRR